MADEQEFPLGAVLTVTTGRLLVEDMGELYDILNFLTQDNLFTHQLPRAGREARPWILEQHPILGRVDASGVTPENWVAWLAEQRAQLETDHVLLQPMPEGYHERRHPLTELEEMMPDKPIIVLEGGSGDGVG